MSYVATGTLELATGLEVNSFDRAFLAGSLVKAGSTNWGLGLTWLLLVLLIFLDLVYS